MRNWPRLALLSVLLLLPLAHGDAPNDDPLFTQFPFESWIAAGEHNAIPWKVQIHPPALGWGLRTMASVAATLEGKEAKRHLDGGRLTALLQITDRDGHTYRDSGTIGASQTRPELFSRDSSISFLFRAQMTPGEYRLALAIVDPSTGEYSLTSRPLLINASAGPLPDLWSALPTVEFLTRENPLAAWFHDSRQGRLNLKLSTLHPVHVKVLLNLPPSGMGHSVYDQAMSVLLVELRVLTQMRIENGSLDIVVLDNGRHRVAFEQANVTEVDWPGLQRALRQAGGNTIDVKSLEMGGQDAGFFVTELNRRLPDSVVILLGSPTTFEQKKSIPQVAESEGRIFYLLRPVTAMSRQAGTLGYNAGSGDPPAGIGTDAAAGTVERRTDARSGGTRRPRTANDAMIVLGKSDDVVLKTLKPAHPRVFELKTAEQFRDALAAILAEIARM